MAYSVFKILVFLTTYVYADALSCYTGYQFQCTTDDTTFQDECKMFNARNQALSQRTCLQGQDRCLLIASRLSFEDKYDLAFITTSCGTGFFDDGCYNRDDLVAMNPAYGQIGPDAFIRTQWKDDFTGLSYEYDTLETCICSTEKCINQTMITTYREKLAISGAAPYSQFWGVYILTSAATYFALTTGGIFSV